MGRKIRVKTPVVESFDFQPGRILAGKYVVLQRLGSGWEGEVYKLRERSTGVERAAKIFYPQRNIADRASNFYARKLHKLRDCPILIRYHTEETIRFRRVPVKLLVSEYIEGELLTHFLDRQPGKRLPVFLGVHLLHTLAAGLERVHELGEYHGDLHTDNIIVRRLGLSFDIKLIDVFPRGAPRKANRDDDLCDLIRIFYDAIGGKKHYARHPPEAKAICCGLKRSLILRKFKTVRRLREHLETMCWS